MQISFALEDKKVGVGAAAEGARGKLSWIYTCFRPKMMWDTSKRHADRKTYELNSVTRVYDTCLVCRNDLCRRTVSFSA